MPFMEQLLRRGLPVSRADLERQVRAAEATVRPNLDMEPTGYLHHLVQALEREQSSLRGVASAALGANPLALFFIPLLLGAALLLAGRRGRMARAPAALCAGLGSITCQVILLFAYQVAHGQLYEGLGVILALFMVGMALGAALDGRGGEGLLRSRLTLAAACLLPAALALLLCWPTPPPPRLAFIALALCSGLVNGALFPLLVRAMGRRGGASLAGKVYGLDLAGASLGAALVGPLLVASLGLRSSCLWLALLSLACYLPLLRRGQSTV